jgi:hypothetical protein
MGVRRAMNRILKFKLKPDQIDSNFDVQVEAKCERVVMVFANAKGRKVVEELWPDVEWATDEIFAEAHSDDWLFTHIRVTKLPPHLEETVPLAFANPDSLGLAVAIALQRVAEPGRVCHYMGYGKDLEIHTYNTSRDRERARTLFAEFVPAGTVVG